VVGGPAVVSEADKEEPVGNEPPPMLAVPETVAGVIVGAVRLSGLVIVWDPRLEDRPDEENEEGGMVENADCANSTLKVPLGRAAVKFPRLSREVVPLTSINPEMVLESKARVRLKKDAFRLETFPVNVVSVTEGREILWMVSAETITGPVESVNVKEVTYGPLVLLKLTLRL
jgi:hypothetical protein